MRRSLIEKMKSDIETTLKQFLYEEGIELSIAANDNGDYRDRPLVELEMLSDDPLGGSALLSKIHLILGVLGKPLQCETLVNGIYEALHPHNVTPDELVTLLMSLHIESVHCVRPRHLKKRAVMQYIVEETPKPKPGPENTREETPALTAKAEYC